MISFFIKHKKSILIITLAFFLGSIIYIGLDAYTRTSYGTNAAQVGGTTISYRTLEKETYRQANALRSKGIDVDDDLMKALEQQTLTRLLTQEVLNQAAQKAGFYVSDYEVAYDIKSLFAPDGNFDKNLYASAVREAYQMSPAEFEKQVRDTKMAAHFYRLLASAYKLTPEEIKSVYQIQNGNVNDFDANRADFRSALLETKLETAPNTFFDSFSQKVKVKTFLK